MSYATSAIRAACTAQLLIASPLGPMLLARTSRGLAGAWFLNQKDHPGELGAPESPHDELLAGAAQQLARHFETGREAFTLPLDLLGTPFQVAVWNALLQIQPGQTCTYGHIAREVKSPSAVRAVGAAIGKNPIGVIVPCHRVIGSNGSLTGYAGGLHRKSALLTLERAMGVKGGRVDTGAADSAHSQARLFEHAA
jgi:methylated-DNA-[protein]-cysteine S-methyltransferase